VKFLILLYVHQDEWAGPHPFDLSGAGDAPRCHIPELISRTTPIALSEIFSELYLFSADFHALSMTRDGTVVFAEGPYYTWYVIDEPWLLTGRMTLAEFGSNGNVRASTPRRPWNMGQTMLFSQIMGRRVLELSISGVGGPPQYNEPYVSPAYNFVPIFNLLTVIARLWK
jgi:hypothetical protein